MIIKKVSLNDDSSLGSLGRYECHAFAVGDPVERKHGFSVNVIGSKSCILVELWWSSHSVLAGYPYN